MSDNSPIDLDEAYYAGCAAMRAEIARLREENKLLRAENENLKAYAKHERDLGAEGALLSNEIEQLRIDAMRYRWLRGDAPAHSLRWRLWKIERWEAPVWDWKGGNALDSALDEDMRERLERKEREMK